LRIEYPGAFYHVINRGNYHDSVFFSDTVKSIFENTLFAACEQSDWILHGFCVLDNHYHLALETPEPNLSVGMQWLQATFANRFNRIVRSRKSRIRRPKTVGRTHFRYTQYINRFSRRIRPLPVGRPRKKQKAE